MNTTSGSRELKQKSVEVMTEKKGKSYAATKELEETKHTRLITEKAAGEHTIEWIREKTLRTWKANHAT